MKQPHGFFVVMLLPTPLQQLPSAVFQHVMSAWKQLRQDVADVSILREHIHKVLIAVGRKSFASPSAQPAPAQEDTTPPRILPEQVQVFVPTPTEASWTSRRFAIDDMEGITRWFSSIVDPDGEVMMISWFQLSALFEHQTGHGGIMYKPTCKRYFLATRDNRGDFVRRTNCFSRWTQGVYGSNCRVLHLRPRSSCIRFWTVCIAIRLNMGCYTLSDSLLAQHQPSFNAVRDFKNI